MESELEMIGRRWCEVMGEKVESVCHHPSGMVTFSIYGIDGSRFTRRFIRMPETAVFKPGVIETGRGGKLWTQYFHEAAFS